MGACVGETKQRPSRLVGDGDFFQPFNADAAFEAAADFVGAAVRFVVRVQRVHGARPIGENVTDLFQDLGRAFVRVFAADQIKLETGLRHRIGPLPTGASTTDRRIVTEPSPEPKSSQTGLCPQGHSDANRTPPRAGKPSYTEESGTRKAPAIRRRGLNA